MQGNRRSWWLLPLLAPVLLAFFLPADRASPFRITPRHTSPFTTPKSSFDRRPRVISLVRRRNRHSALVLSAPRLLPYAAHTAVLFEGALVCFASKALATMPPKPNAHNERRERERATLNVDCDANKSAL